ncbi:MAG TPA: Ig-like domain-containing protein [Chitinophagaceae bacterium]|nr:Ig-like domain-containing protein [Chitinophagaceae bacterium]
MRKLYLFCLSVMTCFCARGQYSLSGMAYHQNFDSLQSGLPEGWSTDSDATDMSLGAAVMLNATPSTATRWNNAGGGFKNVASANGFTNYKSASAALQLSATDRALGLRQTGSFGDPGAAFTFQIDNTFRLGDFELNFKLQTLDSNSGRSTEWLVQYAIGDSPLVFTTQAAYRTGGFTFENNAVAVSFGSLLDDQPERVWIRIVALAASTGGGSRTTTAIDDFELRWTGVASPGYRPLAQQLFPAKGAVAIKPGSILSVKFSRHISLGATGAIRIKNETDNTLEVIPAGSASLSVSGRYLLIAGVLLEYEKTYHVTFDSSIVDTAGAATYALEDTSRWRFTTAPPLGIREQSDAARCLVIDKGNGRAELLLSGIVPGAYTIILFNASGQQFSTRALTLTAVQQAFSFHDVELPPGLYVIRVYNKRSEWVRKFIMR